MKIVRFINDDPKQKEFGIAVRKNVAAYFKSKGISTKGNSTLFIKALVSFSKKSTTFICRTIHLKDIKKFKNKKSFSE